MQITEVYQLTKWIKDEIENANIVTKFDALFSVFNQNVKRPNNQPIAPFEEQKNVLLDAIASININVLSLSQLHVLNILRINQNVGSLGESKLEKILENQLDIAHVSGQINLMKSEIHQGITKSNQLNAALFSIVEDKNTEIKSGEVLTRVIFEHDASVKNIKELKDWTSKWFDIGRGFAIANGQTPEDVHVVGGARGSLIIELALLATTMLPIAKAINLIIDSMVKYKDFQLKAHEVRKMKEGNPKLAEDFESNAKEWEERATQLKNDIAQEIPDEIKQYFSNYQEANQAELEKSVRFLVDFIMKGGDVDCVLPDEEVNDDDESPNEVTKTIRLLKADFSHIRELKETLLLEHKSDVTNND